MKIQGQNEEMLYTASQQFMGKSMKEVMHIATETLEGHQRAIMGNMTIEVPTPWAPHTSCMLYNLCYCMCKILSKWENCANKDF